MHTTDTQTAHRPVPRQGGLGEDPVEALLAGVTPRASASMEVAQRAACAGLGILEEGEVFEHLYWALALAVIHDLHLQVFALRHAVHLVDAGDLALALYAIEAACITE